MKGCEYYMLKMKDSNIGRNVLASFACAKKLNESNDSMQFPSSISDTELDKYLDGKEYQITYNNVNDNNENQSFHYKMICMRY